MPKYRIVFVVNKQQLKTLSVFTEEFSFFSRFTVIIPCLDDILIDMHHHINAPLIYFRAANSQQSLKLNVQNASALRGLCIPQKRASKSVNIWNYWQLKLNVLTQHRWLFSTSLKRPSAGSLGKPQDFTNQAFTITHLETPPSFGVQSRFHLAADGLMAQ